MGRTKKKLAKIVCCGFIAFFGLAAVECRTVEAGDNGRSRYCVIVKPGDRQFGSQFSGPAAGPVSNELRPVTGATIGSFFTGAMKKVGIGTPKCFTISGGVQSDPLRGVQYVHTGPENASAREAAELNGEEGFFPSVGYFNRVSRDRAGVALGVGFGSAPPNEFEEGPSRPEAKVALILGFGF